MKAILLIALAAGATFLTGCETVAVVDRRPVYGSTQVYYSSGRPYYYSGGARSWGYPRGYSGYRGGHRDYDHRSSYSRNVEIERNTYVVNNNRTVYNRGSRDRGAQYRSGQVNRSTNVKVKGNSQTYGKKKKKSSY